MVPNELLSAIKSHNSFMLVSHVSPDGDTVGSSAALALILIAMGKRAFWRCQDEIPQNIAQFSSVKKLVQLPKAQYDAVIAVDCADTARMGNYQAGFDKCDARMVIDHHKTNTGFGMFNYVTDYPATAQCICEIRKALNVPLCFDMAQALYIAFITDTGRFSYRGVTEQTMREVAELYAAGLDCNAINRAIFEIKSQAQVKLLAEALIRQNTYAGGAVSVSCLPLSVLQQYNYSAGDTEGIVNYLLNISGVKVAAFLRQTEDGSIRASLRSACNGCDVSVIAAQFNGGGHTMAAGCTLNCTCEQAVDVLVPLLTKCAEETSA